MLVDNQNELMSGLLFTVHQHGGDEVTWKSFIYNTNKRAAFVHICEIFNILRSFRHIVILVSNKLILSTNFVIVTHMD